MPYFAATEFPLPAHVTITGSSNPNLAAVASLIDEISDEVNAAAAAAGYAVPLTPPASGGATIGYGQVVGLVKKGVTARVLSIAFPNLPGGPGTRTTIGDDYRKEYATALDLIRKGELPIVGAVTDSSGQGRELPRSFSVANPLASSGVTPQVGVGWTF